MAANAFGSKLQITGRLNIGAEINGLGFTAFGADNGGLIVFVQEYFDHKGKWMS
jgi:hypothetical protein